METDIHFLSDNVIKNGSDRETYSLFDDEPKEGKKPEPEKPPEEKKKGFNWGALLVAVVVAVAVVVSVATFGVGAGIACAVAAACIGGLCAAAGAAAISSNSSSGGQNDIGSCIMNPFKGVLSGANMGPLIKSWNSIKGIAGDFYNGLENRADKFVDSPYDFVNWLTVGIPDVIKGTIQSNAERSDKAFDSIYDCANWLSFGSADMVKGTFAPEDPLSKEHWLNSFGLATTIFGLKGSKASVGKTGMIDDIPISKMSNKGVGKARNVEESFASDSYLYQKYKESLVKDDVLNNYEEIITVDKFGDKKLIAELTKAGSNIEDWSKMESVYSYTNEYGTGKIHYYMNVRTGKVSYYDAKMKISAPKSIRSRLKDTVTDKDGFSDCRFGRKFDSDRSEKMILKSKRNIEKEGISVNQLYPVVECEENIQTGIMKFRIYDDCRSLSWKTIDNFSTESVLLENYSKEYMQILYIIRIMA